MNNAYKIEIKHKKLKHNFFNLLFMAYESLLFLWSTGDNNTTIVQHIM